MLVTFDVELVVLVLVLVLVGFAVVVILEADVVVVLVLGLVVVTLAQNSGNNEHGKDTATDVVVLPFWTGTIATRPPAAEVVTGTIGTRAALLTAEGAAKAELTGGDCWEADEEETLELVTSCVVELEKKELIDVETGNIEVVGAVANVTASGAGRVYVSVGTRARRLEGTTVVEDTAWPVEKRTAASTIDKSPINLMSVGCIVGGSGELESVFE